MERLDCFAVRNNGGQMACIALKRMYCRTEKCSFFKTQEQYRKECMMYPCADIDAREGRDD